MNRTAASDPTPTTLDPVARRALRRWMGLAVGSLALAGVFALLLALSRTPGVQDWVPWPVAFFHKALVIHVVFSFNVWFLSVFGALALVAGAKLAGDRPRWLRFGDLALLATAASTVLLFVPALLDRGEPTLNNYVPVIVDPLYYAGLVLLAAGVGLAAARLVADGWRNRRRATPEVVGLLVAALAVLSAIACFGLAYRALGDEPPSHAFNEQLFWGGGHVLQFANVAMLLAAWAMLARAGGGVGIDRRAWAMALLWLVPFVVAAPMLYFLLDPFSADQTLAFTNLQYAFAPPTLAVAMMLLAKWQSATPTPGGDPGARLARHALMLSILTFGVGGFLGLFVDGADTRTPAHYHAVIAGVTLAFMGVFLCVLLPALGRPVAGRPLFAQLWMFGVGQSFAALGLFWAGGYGAPRKTAGAAQGLDSLAAVAGMAMNGLGALVAVIGGVLFIWMVGRALARDSSIAPRSV